MSYSQPKRLATAPAAAAAIAALLLAAASATADDRDLLRESSGDPYLFIILDTSGSMHWSPPCSQAQFDAGECTFLCPEGDCYVPMNGDDPASKFYQAKEALYEVLKDLEGVQLGFATYNQDTLGMIGKHWLYQLEAGTDGIQLPNGGPIFPAAGSTQVFGRTFECNSGGDTAGFEFGNAATVTDAWEMARLGRCAQLGLLGDTSAAGTRLIYIRNTADSPDRTYRFQFRVVSGETIGSSHFHAVLRMHRCNKDNDGCADRTFIQDETLHYDLISDFNSWDNGADRANPQLGYFSQGNAADGPASNTCDGWDPNDDPLADPRSSYNIRFSTTVHPNPSFRPHLDLGDVIPLDWTDDHKEKILDRLAPNRILAEADPDFRTARYFEDTLTGGVLHLRNAAVRPLLANGSTPLGFSLADFRKWWAGCEQGSCQGQTGWSDIAGANDPDWACRKKYLLVITDGDDTCPGRDPCSFTASLHAQEDILTYVVGFGLQNTSGNRLVCMAANGGTGEPILPQNKAELVAALRQIVNNLIGEPAAFAAAAAPSVQAEVEDKLFLSTFTPLNAESVWDGHVDAFLKPLPETDDGRPDESIQCSGTVRAACHLWDAGEVLLTQAPDQSEVDAGNLRLGNAADQRRVFYPKAKNQITQAVPNESVLFEPPATATARQDLWDGLGLNYTLADLASAGSPPDNQANAVIKQTLVEKSGIIVTEEATTEVTYVLGDIFHANPLLIDRPDDFAEFATNRYFDDSDSDGRSCSSSSPGYRCFARKHEFRRKMLAVGANDGMVHLFDAGIWDQGANRFDNGTGKELFAFMPRMVLPIVKEVAEGERQIFSVDGSPRAVSIFLDPEHSSGDPVDPADRRWRTILIGGLREGGSIDGGGDVELDNGKSFVSGYYALDITQPDRLGSDNKPINRDVVPTCLSNYSETACGPNPFGAELWEFTDSVGGSPAEWGVALDEDDNDAPDLGRTWSQPVIGRVRLADGSGGTTERWVMIFGGGFDPASRIDPQSGTWLYMVDIETGEAIYKRQLEGAAPSAPAAVDINNDGYIDVVYIGTTAGYMYKVDLLSAQPLEAFSARDLNDTLHDVQRVTNEAWEPFKIFDTLTGGQRPAIFFPPTVVVVAETGRFALVFGSGDREDLWNLTGVEGRLYVVTDELFARGDAGLPKLETAYTVVDSEGASNDGENFLVRPPVGKARGFVITLDPDERVVAPAFSVAGVTIIPAFQPQIVTDEDQVCARTGDSRVFLILTTNGDAIQPDEGSGAERYLSVGEALVTPPYVDQGATGNPSGAPEFDEEELEWRRAVIDKLKQLFPPRTRFANYTIEVNFRRSDTGEVRPIPIPIGIVEKNWKEF